MNQKLIMAMFNSHGLWEPMSEYVFAAPRKFAFDYAWIAEKIALEVEGGVYGRGKPCPACGRKRGGAHSSVQGILRDITKYNLAASMGWLVFRCTPAQLESGEAAAMIAKAMGDS